MGYIYGIRFTKEDRIIYIGKTERHYEQRFKEYRSYSCSDDLKHFVLEQGGWDNFSFEILLEIENPKILGETELEYIEKYATHLSQGGFNILRTSNGCGLHDISTRIKLCKINNGSAIYVFNLETMRMESNGIDDTFQFYSIGYAAELLAKKYGENFSTGKISDIVHGKKNEISYKHRLFISCNDFSHKLLKKLINKYNSRISDGKPIKVYSKKYNSIFNSCAEAARELNKLYPQKNYTPQGVAYSVQKNRPHRGDYFYKIKE